MIFKILHQYILHLKILSPVVHYKAINAILSFTHTIILYIKYSEMNYTNVLAKYCNNPAKYDP